ncbi:hypothetical protein Lal_00040707 [Lupinus albus]|uniref:Uncharacterized protein n=1 Tax=Lupinus albus TaxID=3870 RepID=A0A6A5NUF1_LUPAL|nr:hypothetical protein Lalb_Chr13g0300031 [Lupinus albus]KAF1887653.1 hypothetical protein Lal_00040707 [Lupinus albus]
MGDDGKPSPETASSTSLTASSESLQHSQVPIFSNSIAAFPPAYYYQMLPAAMYPYPGLTPSQNHESENRRGAGIYAVPTYPYNCHVTGIPYNTLIPLTYTTPTRPSSEGATVGENQGQASQQQQPHQQLPAPQRQVVRRFEVVIRIDLFLMLKLAAMIFMLSDGSMQRLVLLVLFASLVYLYQTGSLTPIIRRLSQAMQRAAAPPRLPRPAPRVQNVPAARPEVENAAPAERQPEAGIGNQPSNDVDGAVDNENVAEPGNGNGGNHWRGIVKEIQMIVFGFITSLLPGFHNHID